MKNLLKYIFAIWLGFSLGVSGIVLLSWQYWFIVVPTIVFVVIFNQNIDRN